MAVDPDTRARTHLANERTFLAWFRTGHHALALGIAGAQFLGGETRRRAARPDARDHLDRDRRRSSSCVGGIRYWTGKERIEAETSGRRRSRSSCRPSARSRWPCSPLGVRRCCSAARSRSGDRPAGILAADAHLPRPPGHPRPAAGGARRVRPPRRGSRRASPTRYGYRPIETPLFEQAAVFERGIGEVTDVVEKELFRIAPRTEEAESWALRPEPTAGIVRAYVQHGMQTLPQPVKLTTTGPMFRYDRPQAGRYRQFWQFDVEAIGDPGPAVDAEIIELGAPVLRGGRRRRRRGPASTRSATRPAGRRTSPSSPTTTAATPTPCRRPSATGWSATPSGCSTRRTRRWPRSTRPRRGSPTACARRARRTSSR